MHLRCCGLSDFLTLKQQCFEQPAVDFSVRCALRVQVAWMLDASHSHTDQTLGGVEGGLRKMQTEGVAAFTEALNASIVQRFEGIVHNATERYRKRLTERSWLEYFQADKYSFHIDGGWVSVAASSFYTQLGEPPKRRKRECVGPQGAQNGRAPWVRALGQRLAETWGEPWVSGFRPDLGRLSAQSELNI